MRFIIPLVLISPIFFFFIFSTHASFCMTEVNTTSDELMNITKPFCQNVNLTDDEMLVYRYSLVLVQYIIPVCVISFVYIQVNVFSWCCFYIFYIIQVIISRWLSNYGEVKPLATLKIRET